jgi:glycosyltransferase involved in cell wall biosynthesis
MLGQAPDQGLQQLAGETGGEVLFETGYSDEQVCAAYSLATVMIFPSLDEGFGWPIAEAQACGCPVITTGEAPMTEVGGDAAFYIPRMPIGDSDALGEWSRQGAAALLRIIDLTAEERASVREKGFKNAARFRSAETMEKIEGFYRETLEAAAATLG